MSQTTSNIDPTTERIKRENDSHKPLERRNFIMMTIAAALIVIGFLLMLGGSSTLEEFNPDIFSTRRIVVGPLITFIGFLFMGVAIIIRPTKLIDTDTANDISQK